MYIMSITEVLQKTSVVAYDGCHKIYLMDKIHTKWFQDYKVVEGSPEDRLEMVESWWDQSCPLRFIEWITINESSELVFTIVVSQGMCLE
jgi:hypothetical protein